MVTVGELRDILKAAAARYPSMRTVDLFYMAKQYHAVLGEYPAETIRRAIPLVCSESDEFFPTAPKIANQCRELVKGGREASIESSELRHRLRLAEQGCDIDYIRELRSAIAQREGRWQQKSIEQQRRDYLMADPAPLAPLAKAITERNPQTYEDALAILQEHRDYWSQRVQDAKYAANNPQVTDEMLHNICLSSIYQILEEGEKARNQAKHVEIPSNPKPNTQWTPEQRKEGLRKLEHARNVNGNGRISHEDASRID